VPTATPILAAVGLPSSFVSGQPSLGVILSASGLATGAAFGQPSVAGGLGLSGIVTGAAYGVPGLRATVACVALGSAEVFGLPSVASGGGGVDLSAVGGIASGAAYGTADLRAAFGMLGVPSAEGLGDPTLSVSVALVGLGAAGDFGQAALRPFVTLAGIASGELFGSPYTIAVSPGTAMVEIIVLVEGHVTETTEVCNSEAETVGVYMVEADDFLVNGGLIEDSVEIVGSIDAEVIGGGLA
jgi:hypothetical protein